MSEFIKLTAAQAIVKYLENQWIEINGSRVRLCGGGFGIFGHGNVTCLGEALYEARDSLPLIVGSMNKAWGSLPPHTLNTTYGSGLCFAPPQRDRGRRT